jgi:hypothetical protein
MHGLAGEVANPTAQYRAEPLVSVSDGRQSPGTQDRMKSPAAPESERGISSTLRGLAEMRFDSPKAV